MSRFVTPGRCADCGEPTGTQARCPACGLFQVGRVADDLRATLRRADEILDVLRRVSASATAPAPAPAAPVAPAPHRGLPAVSVPLVLLGLGTVCVLVAAVVFVAVTWTDLSLAWRTTILLALTGVAAGAAVWAVRRGLRGAAEALTLVVGGLLMIDLVAGNSAGLAVLSDLQGTAFWWVVTLAMLASALAWALWARRTPTRTLLGQQCVAALALGGVVWLAAIGWDYAWEWLGAVVTIAAAGAAFVLWRLRVHVVASAAGVLGAFAWLALVQLGLDRAVGAGGPRELFAGLDAAPLLVASALVAVPACVPGLHSVLRAVAAVPAVAGPVVVALLPARELAVTPALLVVAGAAAALTLAAPAVREPWRPALQVVGAATAVLPAYAVLAGVAVAGARVTVAVADYWSRGLTDPLGPVPAGVPVQAWAFAPLGGLAALAGATVLARRPGVRVAACTGLGVVVGALAGALLTGWSLLVLGLLVAAAGGACVLVAARTGRRGWLPATGVPVAVGVGVALPSAAASAAFLVAHAGVLLVAAALVRAPGLRAAATGLAVALLGGAVEAVGDLASMAPAVRGLALLVFVCVVGGVAQGVARRADGRAWRQGLEVAAVPLALVALAQTAGDSLALTVALTLTGVCAIGVSFASADRRRVAWLGSALLVAASWVRLVALDVDVIEAYTLPGSLALLVAGLVWMRRTPAATSWQALGAPLALGLGPSLAVALQQPTSLRALLVGITGLVLVAAGARLGWGAPLVVGGLAVAALAVVNVAPYAAALPRWVLFGAAGVALLGLGVTWERRRQDLATVHRYAARLR
jgi:hypothetical protein